MCASHRILTLSEMEWMAQALSQLILCSAGYLAETPNLLPLHSTSLDPDILLVKCNVSSSSIPRPHATWL